jgi:outer membrane protein assembly factor BamD (BamD/ComL family)
MPLRVGALLLLLAPNLLCGCSSFSTTADQPFSYEQMRREIEGADRTELSRRVAPAKTASRPVTTKPAATSKTFTEQFKEAVGLGPDPEAARTQYAEADAIYREALALPQGEERKAVFAQAGGLFVAAAKDWPESSLEQDALFLAGESYFFAEQFPESNTQFEKLLKRHPNTRYLDVVEARRFSLAQYWLQVADVYGDSFFAVNLFDAQRPWRDTRGNALRVFDRIRIDDPTGRLADDATIAAANANFRDGNYLRADEFYTDLRKTFPSSEHQFLAHYLGVQSKLRSYEGPEYSGVPLDQAEELVKQIRRQFPADYEQQRDHIDRMYAEIRFRQAEREWSTARYYEAQQAYAAAKFYYDILLDDFSDTPFAEKARERVAEIAGLPPRPEQKLQWLVEMFPERGIQKPLVASGPRVPSSSGLVRR